MSIPNQVLVFTVGVRVCALGVESVVETMRPLPFETIASPPPFVVGTSLIRGEPTPVIDTARVLGGEFETPPSRLILLRFDGRQVGLLASAVVGVRGSDTLEVREIPPLLQDAAPGVLELLGRLDHQLLTILGPAGLLREHDS